MNTQKASLPNYFTLFIYLFLCFLLLYVLLRLYLSDGKGLLLISFQLCTGWSQIATLKLATDTWYLNHAYQQNYKQIRYFFLCLRAVAKHLPAHHCFPSFPALP